MSNWVTKNRFAIFLCVGMGLATIYAWQNNFSLVKWLQAKNYIPGQVNPPTQPPQVQPPPSAPMPPPSSPSPSAPSQQQWLRQFEIDREN